MSETKFPDFHREFPPAGERIAYDPARHDAIAAKVPEAVATEWRNFGFGAYGEGLLWTVVPDEPFFDPKDWAALDETAIEVLRTAFGSVFVWQKENFHWLNVHTGKATSFIPNAELLFDSALIEKNLRKDVL